MGQQMSEDEARLVGELALALQAFIDTSPDHFAALEARRLITELYRSPESAVKEISHAFNHPKTVITDVFSSEKVRAARANVESARNPLGNLYARRRLSTRAKS